MRCFFSDAGLVLLAAGQSACVSSILAEKIVTAPNRTTLRAFGGNSEAIKYASGAYRESIIVEVEQPRASIAVATIEPGDYAFHYDVQVDYPEGEKPVLRKLQFYWHTGREIIYAPPPARGTVLLLHGYLEKKEYMVPWAITLAQAGYRCAVIDLRGHGASTGDHISFGAFESRDVSAVLDDLGRRGWDVSRVGILGVSYGASVGLITAGRDSRVKTVVAFEPFASARRAVPELTRAVFADAVKGISDDQFAAAHRQEAAIAGFKWEDADIPAALDRTNARAFFLHGAADTWLAPSHSEELYHHAPAGSRLLIVPGDNHMTLRLRIDPFRAAVLEWLDQELCSPLESAAAATGNSPRREARRDTGQREIRGRKKGDEAGLAVASCPFSS